MQGGNGNGLAEVLIPITAGTVADRLDLSMWGGTTHNPDPIVAGTYELTGIQTATNTCTVCVAIGAMWPEGGAPNFEFIYFATGGTANITMIDPNPGGVIEYEMTNVTFQHVRLNNGVSTPLDDGCVTAVDRLVYRGTFEGGSARLARDDQVRISPGDPLPRYSRQ